MLTRTMSNEAGPTKHSWPCPIWLVTKNEGRPKAWPGFACQARRQPVRRHPRRVAQRLARRIGHGLAAARSVLTKHAIKQVDRLLSNPGIKIDDILALWVPYVVGARTAITVAMDWTSTPTTRPPSCCR